MHNGHIIPQHRSYQSLPLSILLNQDALADYYRLLAVLEQELSRGILSEAEKEREREEREKGKGRDGRDVSSLNADEIRERENRIGKEEGGSTAGLTLIRLRVWMQEPLERSATHLSSLHACMPVCLILICLYLSLSPPFRPLYRMCLLARMCDAAASLHGGAILSRLHGHTHHGDPRVETFLSTSVLTPVCKPLYHMITRYK
jgi:hypothetical protein